MSKEIQLEIVTPAKRVVSHMCDDVYLPGSMGETGVLPDHAAMVSTLATGTVHYEFAGQKRAVAVKNGFFQVSSNQLMILADDAREAEEINPDALAKEREEIEAKFVSAEVGIEEREELEKERAWLEAQEHCFEKWSTAKDKVKSF